MTVLLPHPVTGQLFASPVPPGLGWPQDPATAATPAAQDAAAVASAAQECRSVEQVAQRVSVCRACPRLVAWREQVAQQKRAAYADQPYWGRPAPSFGDPRPGVLIVGLAPAAHGANRTGRMFTGDRSGDWLYAALHRSGFANQASATAAGDGLVLHGIRITAGAHCAPPQNKPSTSEKRACAPWLERELELLTSVRAIVALGGIAWETTLSAVRQLAWTVPRPKARFGHGAEVELGRADGGRVTLFGCYHVSQQNTFTGRLTEPMLDAVLRSAGRVAGQP